MFVVKLQKPLKLFFKESLLLLEFKKNSSSPYEKKTIAPIESSTWAKKAFVFTFYIWVQDFSRIEVIIKVTDINVWLIIATNKIFIARGPARLKIKMYSLTEGNVTLMRVEGTSIIDKYLSASDVSYGIPVHILEVLLFFNWMQRYVQCTELDGVSFILNKNKIWTKLWINFYIFFYTSGFLFI